MADRPKTAQEALVQFQQTGQYWDPMDLAMRGTSVTESPEQTLRFLKTRYASTELANNRAGYNASQDNGQGGKIGYDPYGRATPPQPAAQAAPAAAPTPAPAAAAPPSDSATPAAAPAAPDMSTASMMTAPPTTPGAGWAAMAQLPPTGQLGVSNVAPASSILSTLGRSLY